MLDWKDATSYQRDEPDPRVPRVWEATVSGMRVRVVIHRLFGVNEMWFGTCDALGIQQQALGHDLANAKAKLEAEIRDRVRDLASALGLGPIY